MKRWWWILPVVALMGLWLGLDAIVEWRTRVALSSLEGYTATFEDASLRITKLDYGLTGLKIMKESAGGSSEPFFYADEIGMSVDWRALWHRAIVARLHVDGAKIYLIAAKQKSEQQLEPEVPDFSERLKAMFPLTIDRIQVRRSEVTFVDKTEKAFPEIWLHDIEATVENLATRAALSRGEPTVVAVSAKLQKTGKVSGFVSADPLAKGLYFSGSLRVADLEMKEFYGLIASKSGLSVKRGTLDVFAQLDCRAGQVAGGVKALIKNPEVVQGKPGLVNKIKAVVADQALELLSDDIPNRDAVATALPIRGNIAHPEAQLWPTVVGLLRNAFVVGVSEGFEHLPPPVANEKEGPLTQLVRGLKKDKGPPKAQPEGGK